jgi:hypothetical protein
MSEKDYKLLNYMQKLKLLNQELSKVKHEINISKLIYSCHGCDTFEDLFRDNIPILEIKVEGILYAIKSLEDENK